MTEVTRITLENEMDIVLAQKQMIQVGNFFAVSLSTKTTIAAAVAEICRVVIDRTDAGVLIIGMQKLDGKYFLFSEVCYDAGIDISADDTGLQYAKKLVPEFKLIKGGEHHKIIVAIGLPRSLQVSLLKINEAKTYFQTLKPGSPYEELKLRNSVLNEKARIKEEELLRSKMLDEKKNEFISVASHELKTPLTSLMAFTGLALSMAKSENSPKLVRFIEKIQRQTDKLHTLVRQLLDVSRIESGKLEYNFETISWQNYLSEIRSIVDQMVSTHQVKYEFDQTDGDLVIDLLRIEQVFTNLVTNAIKYSPKDKMIRIGSFTKNNILTVFVADEGIGVAKENFLRIFERYYRDPSVEKNYSGFGMGLYISADIISEHGGRIWAEANTPAGTIFYFELPIQNSAGSTDLATP